MILNIPSNTRVFRRRVKAHNGKPFRWHLLKQVRDNGFTKEDHPAWSETKTYISFCGLRIDTRYGDPELSKVESIKSICHSCWPYNVTHDA